jgi:hypothetical protein
MAVCANCGKTIGALETPQTFKNQPVCFECFGKLKAQSGGGGFLDPATNKKAAGRLFHVFFWIISGLIILGLLSMIMSR